ncbi:MAG: coniferyl-alcohol dehydrogenase [Amylibacter sp.]|nr:coniferyl-alcohol dehydrogenase [Amylibacter sp.]
MSKTIAVTGVASGIGAALARILSQRGHTVIGFDKNPAEQNVHQFIHLDLNDPSSITNAVKQCPSGLDGLCNNAGLPPRDGLEDSILQVNFIGTRAFTDAMVPKMLSGSSLVNMASRAGHHWQKNLDQLKRLAVLTSKAELEDFITKENIDATRAYNLSKEAIILWTLATAERMANANMRVNSLSPGGIATDILDDFKRAFGDIVTKNVKRAGRPGKPEEVAEIAIFLLMPESHWIKGADITIDGGMGSFNMADTLDLDVFDTA